MRYLITGIILALLGGFFVFAPMDNLYQVFPNIPSPMIARIGGGVALVMAIFILILQIGEWMGKF